ncbi:hypothetical protein [Dinghuibacter silviterrae]|uniref:DUF3945 domain-containing protein n=1 Tax=Dinghuibacter silviterrae TaxID=1539049 RepID=A0A4R8DH86_9BACT|nr:hypothetical protein [Dinghuibacter silviterrae]TDW97071.1 hypothetical protein EDB95_4911 [Dinghuibacter silviterrae]
MTQDNLDYVTRAFTNVGFPPQVRDLLSAGMEKGLPTIIAGGNRHYDAATHEVMRIEGRADQGEQNTERYFPKGYQATLKSDTMEEARTQFIHIYDQKGFHVDQTRNLLSGKWVFAIEKDRGEEKRNFTRLNFDEKVASGNYKRINVKEDDYPLFKLLNKVSFVDPTEADLKDMLKSLFKGDTVSAKARLEGNIHTVQVDMRPDKGELLVYTPDNKISRTYSMGDKIRFELDQLPDQNIKQFNDKQQGINQSMNAGDAERTKKVLEGPKPKPGTKNQPKPRV